MADVCFPKPEVVIIQLELRYVDEIWLADTFWPSESSNIDKHETGSSIERPRLPS